MNNQDIIEFPFSLPRYHTYLLRCWQEQSTQDHETVNTWRFSLEDPQTGQRRGFANLETLLNALLGELVDK